MKFSIRPSVSVRLHNSPCACANCNFSHQPLFKSSPHILLGPLPTFYNPPMLFLFVDVSSSAPLYPANGKARSPARLSYFIDIAREDRHRLRESCNAQACAMLRIFRKAAGTEPSSMAWKSMGRRSTAHGALLGNVHVRSCYTNLVFPGSHPLCTPPTTTW